MSKYKLTWKDLTARDFKTYLFAMFKAFIPKKKIYFSFVPNLILTV